MSRVVQGQSAIQPTRVLVVYGTRPEAIKMAPVIGALRARSASFAVTVCSTGQHREMLAQIERLLGFTPDLDLALMQPSQSLNGLCAAALAAIDAVLERLQPDWLLVQGDTTSALAAALAAFHRGIAVGHVEAGLRTDDLANPFPEEANRRMIDVLARAHFAPTKHALGRLLAEGHAAERVYLVGNTVIDALGMLQPGGESSTADEVLVTVHRRESFGAPLRGIFVALRELAVRFPETRWIFPVHPNPEVRQLASELLSGLPNLELTAPLDYRQLLERLARCRLVLTDSGGLQEEAPAFHKPVLVLRETTERPEGIASGVALLVGRDPQQIVAATTRVLSDPATYAALARGENPYGDGHAAERIAAILTGEPWTPFAAGMPRQG